MKRRVVAGRRQCPNLGSFRTSASRQGAQGGTEELQNRLACELHADTLRWQRTSSRRVMLYQFKDKRSARCDVIMVRIACFPAGDALLIGANIRHEQVVTLSTRQPHQSFRGRRERTRCPCSPERRHCCRGLRWTAGHELRPNGVQYTATLRSQHT
jgi:hypothetical protein